LLDEAEEIATRIMIMNKGKIKVDGDLDAIMKQTRTKSLEDAFIKVTR
jgi:ABC-type multidrug transport system ATPase subunit